MGFLRDIFIRKSSLPADVLRTESENLIVTANDVLQLIGASSSGRINTSTVEGQSAAFNRASIVDALLFEKVSSIRDCRFWLNNDKGEEVDNPAEFERLTTPNQYETFKEFVGKIEFFTQLYGRCYIAKVRPVGFSREVELHVIPNLSITENHSTAILGEFKPYNTVESYTVTLDKTHDITLAPEEVEVISDVSFDLCGFGGGSSRLVSLEEPINNYIAAQQATNELLVNRGMLGIISMKSGVDAGIAQQLPQTKADKEALLQALDRYGITRGKAKYAITSYEANYIPVSSTIADMGLSKIHEECKYDICNAYQVPTVILDVSGSTYSNYGEAKKKMITGDIQPSAQMIADFICRVRGAKGLRLSATFDHLDIFQEAKRSQAAGLTSLVTAVRSACEAGLIDQELAKQTILKYLTE